MIFFASVNKDIASLSQEIVNSYQIIVIFNIFKIIYQMLLKKNAS
jgi:hypothetical protein